jgi:hypothetical protein
VSAGCAGLHLLVGAGKLTANDLAHALLQIRKSVETQAIAEPDNRRRVDVELRRHLIDGRKRHGLRLLDDIFGDAFLRMGQQIVTPAQLLDHVCGFGGHLSHLFDRRSGHHGYSSDVIDLLHHTKQRQLSSRARKGQRAEWTVSGTDAVSEASDMLIHAVASSHIDGKGSAAQPIVGEACIRSAPRQSRGERYSKTERRQFACPCFRAEQTAATIAQGCPQAESSRQARERLHIVALRYIF